MTCIGEPISWPRLERFARTGDGAVAAHLAACAACAACLDEIRHDVVALPPLVVAAPAPARRRWGWFVAPALAVAMVLLVLIMRREPTATSGVKGDALVIDVVRERAGATREGARTFLPGDRWKVLVTCAPGTARAIDVTVADGATLDRPLASAAITCGNRVAIPGAFTLTGTRPNRVCVEHACVTIDPE